MPFKAYYKLKCDDITLVYIREAMEENLSRTSFLLFVITDITYQALGIISIAIYYFVIILQYVILFFTFLPCYIISHRIGVYTKNAFIRRHMKNFYFLTIYWYEFVIHWFFLVHLKENLLELFYY